MNAHAQTNAVAGTYSRRRCALPSKPPMHRSRFAYLFDLTDEKEREACRKLSYFHRGGDYTAVEFRRAVQDGQRILWAIVDTVPRWRDRYRWSLCWWNIDTARQGWHDCRTRDAAQHRLNAQKLH
jgi:hypothetical protein